MRVVRSINGFLESNVYSSRSSMEFLFMFLMVYIVLDVIILAWFFAAPLAVQSSNRLIFGLGMSAYNIGYLVSYCHQMFQHSILIGDFELPFCSRDTAIYVGCLIGGILPMYVKLPKFTQSLAVAALLMIPMAADGITQSILIMRESTNTLRIVTGLLFGIGMVYFFSVRIVEHARKFVSIRDESMKAVRIGVFSVLVLLACSYYLGGMYVTKEEAIRESGLNPTFVTYATARSLLTTRYDPYLNTYDDAVLKEMIRYGPRGNGVWIIYEGTMEHQGKYVFFSGGNGRFEMISDSGGS
jgi:uncharacterized membrane protein